MSVGKHLTDALQALLHTATHSKKLRGATDKVDVQLGTNRAGVNSVDRFDDKPDLPGGGGKPHTGDGRYDGDGSDGSGTPPRTPNNPNNGSDGDSPPLPSPASQHQARVEAGNASEPDWHRVTTGHHGPPPPDMDAAHGHHIVFKKGVGRRQQEVLADAKAILDKHGINWYTGSENLIWAPNVAGQHTIANVREVLRRLQEADGQGSEAVAEALRLAGRELFGGKP